MLFDDRIDAGRRLAARLARFRALPDTVVLALPRGGVPVGFEIARELQLPLDVFVVRKLGAPGQEELAMGAVASGGVRVIDASLIAHLGVSDEDLREVIDSETRELERRTREFRGDAPPPDVRGKQVILVDDGLATGSTMKAAVLALRKQQPGALIVAVPVGAKSTCAQLREFADEVVCLESPIHFQAVGEWYRDFTQTTDDEVRELLRRNRALPRAGD
jgi:predicted phosphoribosyltransferase